MKGMTPRESIERLPNSVRVAGFTFGIEKWNADQARGAQRWGECSSNEQKIRIQLDMPSAFKAVDTVMHEILHAIYWAYNIHDEDKEERAVSTLATALMTLHRDNPWLATWISEALT